MNDLPPEQSASPRTITPFDPDASWDVMPGVDWKKMFLNVAKGAGNILTLNPSGFIDDLSGAFSAINFDDSVEVRAWRLIQRACWKSLKVICEEYLQTKALTNENPEAPENIVAKLNWDFLENFRPLDQNFFTHPETLPFLPGTAQNLAEMLTILGMNKIEAQTLAQRLPAYFVYELTAEWSSNTAYYQSVHDHFSPSPFDTAQRRIVAWRNYRAQLIRKINEPVFGDSFGLNQVYIPLRGWYEKASTQPSVAPKQPQETTKQRHVIDVDSFLESWLTSNQNRRDAIKLLSGEPGSGKSSIGRMLAAKVANWTNWKVVFIPLHKLHIETTFGNCVDGFAKEIGLGFAPIAERISGEKLLVIFDGLDELSSQGKPGEIAVNDFIDEVLRGLPGNDNDDPGIRVLLSGRNMSVKSSVSKFRSEGGALHLLPYVCQHYIDDNSYHDPHNLLDHDQRQSWWQKYIALKGLDKSSIPSALDKGHLGELTSEPLLNYLVAMAQGQGMNIDSDTNLNQVYHHLICGVFNRVYEDQRTTIGLTQDKFFETLEEIAHVTWQNGGRGATREQIITQIAKADLLEEFTLLQGGAENAVSKLLASFYFKSTADGARGTETFEFTHKSFGEYLTARKILLEASYFAKGLNDPTDRRSVGKSEAETLKSWAEFCGDGSLDGNILRFLRQEALLRNHDFLNLIIDGFERLFSRVLTVGSPIPNGEALNDILEQINRNECLLVAVLSASCIGVPKRNWNVMASDDALIFRSWLNKIKYRDLLAGNLTNCLNHINLTKCHLQFTNLSFMSMHNAVLTSTDFSCSWLFNTDLTDADLTNSIFTFANMNGVNLSRANLTGAHAINAILANADLTDANLTKANLSRADLSGANLTNVNLAETSLSGARITGAIGIKDAINDAKARNSPPTLDKRQINLLKTMK